MYGFVCFVVFVSIFLQGFGVDVCFRCILVLWMVLLGSWVVGWLNCFEKA